MWLTHGMSRTPEYRTYIAAMHRCRSTDVETRKYYLDRNIKFLFSSFEQFFAELGTRPKGMTLDRINVDGNYEPGNVRWATRRDQMINRREFTICRRGHPFTAENIYLEAGRRRCRKCMYARHKKYKRDLRIRLRADNSTDRNRSL